MQKFAIGVLVSFALGSQASADYFWVLGSYSKKSNAFSEQERLTAVLSSEVLVVPNPSSDTFRVITRRENLTQDLRLAAGVQAWLIDIAVTVDEHNQVPSGVVPALPPAQTGETLAAWCDRVAPRPEYCDPTELTALEVKRKHLERYREELQARCADVTDEREKEICSGWAQTQTQTQDTTNQAKTALSQ